MNFLLDIEFANVFSHYVACLFIQLASEQIELDVKFTLTKHLIYIEWPEWTDDTIQVLVSNVWSIHCRNYICSL